jgi:hypothetical protein
MYMRVRRARFDPARLDDVGHQQVARDLVAAVRRQPGCQSLVQNPVSFDTYRFGRG